MTSKMNSRQRFVRCPKCLNVLPEPAEVPVYKCGGCGATLQAKKRVNSTVDTTSHRPDNNSSGKQKMDQDFGDQIQEAGSSSNQQLLVKTTDESDHNSDNDDMHKLNKDQDDSNKPETGSIDATGKQKQKQLSDDHEDSSSNSSSRLNKQSVVRYSMSEQQRNIVNDPRSSTELSGHEDPESSPEATGHNRNDQEQEPNQFQNRDQDQDQDLDHSSGKHIIEHLADNNVTPNSLNQQLIVNSISNPDQNSDRYDDPDHQEYNDDDTDQVFLSCRHDTEFEESSSEFEEAFANRTIVRDSNGGSKSSFKSLIAEKLLDTKQKKPVYLDEDDELPEEGRASLHHRRTFARISSVETTNTAGGTIYHGYEGSVSSFDGNQNPRKHRIGLIGDEHVDRFNRRNQIHSPNGRLGKHEHRSTEIRSIYGLNEWNEFHRKPKHRSHMISENPKLERIELLKKVKELQDQLDRTNISNHPHVLNSPVRFNQRMAFSGETTAVNRRLDGSACHHRPFSAQLPRQAQHFCCNGPHFEPNTYYSPRSSGLSTPIHNHEPEYGYGFRQRNERPQTGRAHSKRYVRPIANGSPWIACYRCYKLLELPQSFLVFNKRYHSLKCGACMKVLNFTLSNGSHISRYYPEETITAPPSSEVEDYTELNGSRAEPVSCSDRSFQKSYSTETDRNGSWEFNERRKAVMSRGPSGSSQPSSSKVSGRRKVTSEIEVERRPNGSPLHRLMGYETPSRVLRG